MAKAKFSQPVLNAEQQAEAELIYERIRGAFDEEARCLAALMASKETRHIFGETEYQIRDRVHALGAQVLEATAQERVKEGRLSGSQLRRPALPRRCSLRVAAGEAPGELVGRSATEAGLLPLSSLPQRTCSLGSGGGSVGDAAHARCG